MGDPPQNVCSSQFLSTLSAAKNYEFEKKKTALFRSREQASPAKFAELTIARQLKRSRSWNSEERSMPVRPRFPVFIAASGLVCYCAGFWTPG
jgi:hypothetical protein